MTTHADRLRSYAMHRCDHGNVEVNWRGIAMVWDREEPMLATVHVDDPDEFDQWFGAWFGDSGTPDENAVKIVDSLPVELLDAASDAYLKLAEEDGCRVSTDPMTGEQRLVQP